MAALYDPRYDYPDKRRQSFIGSLRDLDRRNQYLRLLHPDTVPPAQAAPALTPSHLTGPKMGSAPQPALQTGAYPPEMPIDDFAEPPLTEAQKHARANIPAVATYYDENGDLVPAGTASINADQGDIVSNNTGITGDYTEEAKKELFGPTANEIRDNRRSGILMNQDPARYLRDGSSLDDGMGNIYSLEGGDKDDVFQSLVKRFLDEGFGREESIAKAIEQMEKPALQLLKENSAELGTFMMDKLGPDGERNYWPYVPWSDTKLGRYLESKRTTEAREALPSMKDAERMKRINNPLSGTGGALSDPSTDNGKAALTVTEQQQQQLATPKPTQSTVRSTTGGHTGNARGSDLPDMQIGLNERLMRMGAAGLAAGGQGSLAQMGAMFGASADVNQANRQAEMEAFGIEEERRQAHAARVAALAAAKSKGAGGGDIGSVGDVRMGMAKLQTALDMFDADTNSSLSGYNWQAIYSRLYGRTLGNEDEAKRLFLNELRLDSIMQRVAETKGAISNAEMQLFASQAPTMDSNDIVWTSWLKRQLQMQKIILNRLQTGQRVDESAPITTTMPNLDRGGGGSTGSGADFTEADKLVGI